MPARRLLIASGAIALSALGACASRPQSAAHPHAVLVGHARYAKSNTKLMCIKHTRVGTLIPQIYCMTEPDYKTYEKEAKKSGRSLDSILNAPRKSNCSSARSCTGSGPPR